jgi:hypothetical protein
LENVARCQFILGSHLTLQTQLLVALDLYKVFGCQKLSTGKYRAQREHHDKAPYRVRRKEQAAIQKTIY